MLGWAGQQQAQAPPLGTVFGGVGPRASFNGSVSEGGSFGTGSRRRRSLGRDVGGGEEEGVEARGGGAREESRDEAGVRRVEGDRVRGEGGAEGRGEGGEARGEGRKRAARAARRAAEEAETRRLVKEQALRELRAQLQQPAQAAALTA